LKAIIIAAGKGKRLKHLTQEIPKCLLKLNGKTLLQTQIDTFHLFGIFDITVVTGYQREKINLPGCKYYYNDNYSNNNILCSLFYAEKEMNDDVIITYSDIVFEKSIIEKLLTDNNDISIVVDIDWKKNYIDRKDHPIAEAENVVFNSDNELSKIGKTFSNTQEPDGEFIGMAKLTQRGTDIFKKFFWENKNKFSGKPFQKASSFENAYLTDMFQELVDNKIAVHCVTIEKSWKEIDTIEDYEKALAIHSHSTNE
jgi:choline kinase|tara:strand:+ start:3304 stop:4068 length:765 start_codon:yes stop_codon:yes gene_type:complete